MNEFLLAATAQKRSANWPRYFLHRSKTGKSLIRSARVLSGARTFCGCNTLFSTESAQNRTFTHWQRHPESGPFLMLGAEKSVLAVYEFG